MLESTRRKLVEICDIAVSTADKLHPDSIDCRQKLMHISRIAETALAEERAHEKAQLLAVNNPESEVR
jgi:hypothetical protein